MEKTWRCTVCGYLHKGPTPPAVCPVCQADASKFELVIEEGADESSRRTSGLVRFIQEMRRSFVPHAVAAHFPNALAPTALLFCLLYQFSKDASFETTSFYLLLVAALTAPATFVTGFYDWQKKFSGELTGIFRKKIILGICLILLSLGAAFWRWREPAVLTSGGFSACAYSILLLVILGCVTLLGHYGGLLVFAKHKS